MTGDHPMTSFVLVVAGIAFMSGAVAAVFIMLIIGIRKGDRRLRGGRSTPLGALTRTALSASTWPSNPVVHGDREDH
jgi:hypothetical protein